MRLIPGLAVLLFGLALPAAQGADGREWLPLAKDGIHDPRSPAVQIKQEPADALSALPADEPGYGNLVRWVKALEGGHIKPRTNLYPETKVNVLDMDVILNRGGSMPMVRFPHKPHTLWLDCSNCHEHLFKYKAGQTKITMLKILEGEQCGVCHGAVAFPLIACNRCHSVPQGTRIDTVIEPGQYKP
jgi:c(7)-type cytochrome triheme protein